MACVIRLGALLISCWVLLLHHTQGNTVLPLTYMDVSYKELNNDVNVRIFHSAEITDFSMTTEYLPNNELIVGARNYLLRLDLTELLELQTVTWKPSNQTINVCMAKGQSEVDCQNSIRVLILHGDKVFVCGTNAFQPNCTWRQRDNLEQVDSWLPGEAKCPYSANDNSTALMTENGDFYGATVTDFIGRDPAIYRSMGPSIHLRTVQYNSRWLNEPDFVSSYEIGNFIYIFFREPAVEYINCGKTVYSRVSRICKSDTGGNYLLEENWTTFIKARLNCSKLGDYPFYFNELQSTYYDSLHKLVYGLFTTSPNGMYASAVCVFNMSAIDQVFSGPYKYQENANMAWARVTNDLPNLQCSSSNQKRSVVNHTPQRILVNAQKFQLMDNAVPRIPHGPMIVAENERFTHIVVDEVHVKHHENVQVVYLSTLEGAIKKIAMVPAINLSCVVEVLHVVPSDQSHPIKSLKLIKELNALFVGTNDKLYKIPLQRCDRYKTKRLCVSAQDPYCGWDDRIRTCTTIRPNQLPDRHWHQNITSCPLLELPENGGWSDWSDWANCRHTGDQKSGDQCLCRGRSCDNPRPRSGGKPCDGVHVEIINCTVNGEWTQWSDWSGCSATCGLGTMTRRRICGNPEPRFDGRICVGSEVDEEPCNQIDCAKQIRFPVDGAWSHWSEWSLCSKKCGEGVQSRVRDCNNPSPEYGGALCVGNRTVGRICTATQCEGMKKATEMSPWIRLNCTKDGYQEVRYHFVCKVRVADPFHIRTNVKPIHRSCTVDGSECNEPGEWSCWSDYTACSVTCGMGIKSRTRRCQSENGHASHTIPCLGGRGREDAPCKMPPCYHYDGWGEWTMWSVCYQDNIQHRKRKCQLPSLQDCGVQDLESRMCRYDKLNVYAIDVKEKSEKRTKETKYEIYYLIISGIVGFALGGFVCVGIYLYCKRQRAENKSSEKTYNSLQRHEVKQNHYVSPHDLSLDLSPLNNKYYSTGSLKKTDNHKLTVKEASDRRDTLLRSNSIMRTNLNMSENDY